MKKTMVVLMKLQLADLLLVLLLLFIDVAEY
jgi:hypothetical protein